MKKKKQPDIPVLAGLKKTRGRKSKYAPSILSVLRAHAGRPLLRRDLLVELNKTAPQIDWNPEHVNLSVLLKRLAKTTLDLKTGHLDITTNAGGHHLYTFTPPAKEST